MSGEISQKIKMWQYQRCKRTCRCPDVPLAPPPFKQSQQVPRLLWTAQMLLMVEFSFSSLDFGAGSLLVM